MTLDLNLVLLIYVVVLLALLAGGMWIAFTLGAVGMLALYASGGGRVLDPIAMVLWNTTNSFVLTAVPLFLLMGELIHRGGFGAGFYEAVTVWLRKVRGSILYANIIGCCIFSAISGASIVTAATMGTVALPEAEKRGYDRKLTFGTLAAGGTLGILIPPSIPMIVYASMVQESVGKVFLAGIIPGLLLTGAFIVFVWLRLWRRPELAPTVDEDATWGDRFSALPRLLPVLLPILIVIGGMYAGIMTPTEAAAVGALVALVEGLLARSLTWQVFRESLLSCSRTTAMILFIVIGAQIMSFALVNDNIPRQLSRWVVSQNMAPVLLLAAIFCLYLVLGMFIDGLSMMLLTLPVVYPIITSLGLDPIWFCVALVILIEIGQITPPVGLNLFVIHGLAKHRPASEIIVGSAPYVVLMVLFLLLLTAFPNLALWLPNR